jgi:hypothetical protein
MEALAANCRAIPAPKVRTLHHDTAHHVFLRTYLHSLCSTGTSLSASILFLTLYLIQTEPLINDGSGSQFQPACRMTPVLPRRSERARQENTRYADSYVDPDTVDTSSAVAVNGVNRINYHRRATRAREEVLNETDLEESRLLAQHLNTSNGVGNVPYGAWSVTSRSPI